jgi:hypothetical protein
MIGERLESRRQPPWAALLLLSVGLGLVAAGFLMRMNAVATAAVLPLALAGAFWLLAQERPFAARFREDGLEIESARTPSFVPYSSIQNIKVGGRFVDPAKFRKSSCALAVLHEGGVLRIPARLNYQSHEVLLILAERVPGGGGRDVNPVLAEYLKRQEHYFGPESVATFRAASRRYTGARRGYRACCSGLMAAGAVWSFLGLAGYSDTAWGFAGILCVVFGGLFYAATFADATAAGPTKNWKNASLVIGHEGMAMVQGDIQGEVRWPELREIRWNEKPSSFKFATRSAIPGILLGVKGANIVIADIYDRPLYVIYNRILAASGRTPGLDRA